MRTRTQALPPAASSPPPAGAAEGGGDADSTSPYSLSKEDLQQLTEEFDDAEEELTTLGRTYEELLRASQSHEPRHAGRASLAADAPDAAAPDAAALRRAARHVNGSRGTLRSDGTARPSRARGAVARRPASLNLSHISSSSDDEMGLGLADESALGESWSPIRTSLEGSFAGNGIAGGRHARPSFGGHGGQGGGGSLSPIRDRSSRSLSPARRLSSPSPKKPSPKKLSPRKLSPGGEARRGASPTRSPTRPRSPRRSLPGDGASPPRSPAPAAGKSSPRARRSPRKSSTSPVRSPLGDISPNRVAAAARGTSPKRKQKGKDEGAEGGTTATMSQTKKGLSPNSALKESGSNMSVSSDSETSAVQGALKARTFVPTRDGDKNAERETHVMEATKKGLSPNGTHSLKEAEGARWSSTRATTTDEPDDEGSDMPATPDNRMSTGQGALESKKIAPMQDGGDMVHGTENTPEPKKDLLHLLLRGEGLESRTMERKVAAAQENKDTTMLSPPKHGTKSLARSPAPTPNSRRRVIKRFRASVPSAKYLMPEDLMEDSMEPNMDRKNDVLLNSLEKNPRKNEDEEAGATHETAAEPTTAPKPVARSGALQPAYENAFAFPHDSIPAPSTKTMLSFHDKAVANGIVSHQYQLNRAGANCLSVQEVIWPSIAYETTAVLKREQAKAQRNIKEGMPDSQGKEVVKAIETCRRVVKSCTSAAVKAIGEAWRDREKERERARVETLAKERERQRLDRKQAKKERKEARSRARRERYERQRREKTRNHPRNKELWQEVTKLMMDIQKLEKEERLWKEASAEVARMEEHYHPPKKMVLESIAEGEAQSLVDEVDHADVESTGTRLVQDVTMATERINWMLKSVSLAMDESERLRKEAYDKYQYDGLKFYGYPKVDDSKGLFMALSMESPMRE